MPAIPNHNARQRRKIKALVFQAWHNRCAYCDAPAAHLDHVVPRILDGAMACYGNLVPACEKCNLLKGWLSLRVFLKSDPERVERIMSYLAFMAAAKLGYDNRFKAPKRKERRKSTPHDNDERHAASRLRQDHEDLSRATK